MAIKQLLRTGLINPDKRSEILLELRKLPTNRDVILATAALKDPFTVLDDMLDIESGKHYENYIKNNIKQDNIIKEGNIVNADDLTNEDSDVGFNVKDSFGKDNDLKINVDLKDLFHIEIGDRKYGTLSNPKSNDKILSCLKIFNDMCETDKADIIDSILLYIESIKKKQSKKPSKKSFINAINEQLSPELRKDFIGLLLVQAKNNYK